MEISLNQLQDIIANNDMDVAVVRNEPGTINGWLRDMGYFVPMKDIKAAVKALRADAYYSQLISDGFAQ